jgi:hypothetical protein
MTILEIYLMGRFVSYVIREGLEMFKPITYLEYKVMEKTSPKKVLGLTYQEYIEKDLYDWISKSNKFTYKIVEFLVTDENKDTFRDEIEAKDNFVKWIKTGKNN